MLTFIPLAHYLVIYQIITFAFICYFATYAFCSSNFANERSEGFNLIIFFLVVFIFVYTGFRPVSFQFGDMGNYNRLYQELANGGSSSISGDILFYKMLYFFSQLVPAEIFFIICYAIYFFTILYALKRMFGGQWVWPFIAVISLFSFWQYGTNGIRNGLATSIFLLGLSYKGGWRWLFFIVAFGFHSSILLPIMSVVLAFLDKNTKHFFAGWFLCLLVSIAVPSIGDFISGLGFLDDKISHYAAIEDESVGTREFRVDFLLFSVLPIIFGYQYLKRVNFDDDFYHILLSIYLTCNAFWLLVIRYPASNRFAYLSWFLYGLILAYPFMNNLGIRYQNRFFGFLIMFLFLLSLYIVKG